MSRYHSYLNTTRQIISSYKGTEPFSSFLKTFFSANKKFGSTDRKRISQLCYAYFRLGKAALSLSVDERVLLAQFLCIHHPDPFLQELKPEWNEKAEATTTEKLSIIGEKILPDQIFPWKNEISEGIEYEKFCLSFLDQPDLFIRLRPGRADAVLQKLKISGLSFQQLTPSCVALLNHSKLEAVLEINREVIVQDKSSQQVADFFPEFWTGNQNGPFPDSRISVWDCCAASGGKSILANDILGAIDLTVSDNRESILVNLKKRFREAGIAGYKSFVADLASPAEVSKPAAFDLVIADVPCTGSGTWGRTPEQLFFFNEKLIGEFALRQKKIISNVIPAIKPGGYLLYITCSVFEKENNEIADFVSTNFNCLLHKKGIIKGYDQKADTMFAALLQRPL